MAETTKKTTKAPAPAKAAAPGKAASPVSGGSVKMIRIRWYRSAIATPVKHKKIVKGLGFTRLNQIVERENTPSIRGMVKKIPHLLKIEE